jgi:hypothetical protein
MALEMTFKQICDLVRKDGKVDLELMENIDALLGLALLCAPVLLGPAALAFLPTLEVKGEIVKICTAAFRKITGKSESDYLARQQRMQMAYGLLCFTAFFEALDANLPVVLRNRIGLLRQEKATLAKEAADKADGVTKGHVDARPDAPNALTTAPIPFPHPTESLA